MYSNKQKWDFYKKISGELYTIITSNLDLEPIEVIREMAEHLDKYNEKTPYHLSIKSTDEHGEAVYIMREKSSPLSKELFRKEFHVKNIIRKIKINDLLSEDLFDDEDDDEWENLHN